MKVNIKKLQEKYNKRIKKIGKNKFAVTIAPKNELKNKPFVELPKMKTYWIKTKRPKYRPIKSGGIYE